MQGNGQNTNGGGAIRMTDRAPLIHDVLLAELGDNWAPAHISAALKMLDGGALLFPPGERAIPPGMIGAIERARLIAAMLEAVGEHGLRNSTIDEVVVRRNLTRKVLYAHFDGVDELYLASLDSVIWCVTTRLADAMSADTDSWREGFRIILGELVIFASEEPDAACTLLVEARRAGPAAVRRLDACIEHFERSMAEQLEQQDTANVPKLAIPGIVGGVTSLLYKRIASGEAHNIHTLLPDVVYFALVPYIGHEAALDEMRLVRTAQ